MNRILQAEQTHRPLLLHPTVCDSLRKGVTQDLGLKVFANIFVFSMASLLIFAGCGIPTSKASKLANGRAAVFTEPLTRLAFTIQPTNATANSPFPKLTVSILDINGNIDPVDGVTIAISLYSPIQTATIGGISRATTVKGIATFTDLVVPTPGRGYRFTAAANLLTAVNSNTFDVTPMGKLVLTFPKQNLAVGETIVAILQFVPPPSSKGILTMPASGSSIQFLLQSETFLPGERAFSTQITALRPGVVQVSASATGYEPASSQTITAYVLSAAGIPAVHVVEDLGKVDAQQAANGLGFNIGETDWEFQMAQQLGSTWARVDCVWAKVEVQNADNTSGGYKLPSDCKNVMDLSKKYGQRLSLTAYWGPPYHSVSKLKVSSLISPGTTELPVSWISGQTLSKLASSCFDSQSKPLCELVESNNSQITSRWDYSGSLITSIDQISNSLVLASATSVSIGAGVAFNINQLLYSPILIPDGGDFLNDPSTNAFVSYTGFLASELANNGATGSQVGLYNEPNWLGGYWLHGQLLYDPSNRPAAQLPTGGTNNQVAFVVAANAAEPGVQYVSNFTNLDGFSSMLFTDVYKQYTSLDAIQKNFASEAFHIYGNNPEDEFWSTSCLIVKAQEIAGYVERDCSLPGEASGGNHKDAVLQNFYPKNNGGLSHSITETGNEATDPYVGSRFDLRQFLGFQALGVSPVMFFKFDGTNTKMDWVNAGTHQPYQVYTDFKELMSDLQSISGPPALGNSTCNDPAVKSYSGYYPLDTAEFVGTKSNDDKVSSILFFTWQRSFVTSGKWSEMSSPPPGQVTVSFSPGYSVSKIEDLVTLQDVDSSVIGSTVTYAVADNPIEVFLSPVDAIASQKLVGLEVSRALISPVCY